MSRSANARSDAGDPSDRAERRAKRRRAPREHPLVKSDLNLGTGPLPCEIDLLHSLVGHLLDLDGRPETGNDADHGEARKAKP